MIAWMLYLVVVSVLLAIAARCAEAALLLNGRPMRFVWLAALTGSLALPLLIRLAPAAEITEPKLIELPQSSQFIDLTIGAGTRSLLDRIQLPARVERAAGLTWAVSTALAFLALSLFFGGLGVAARRWPRGRLDDGDVRLSRGAGPAVFGLLRPVIVVPSWLIHSPAEVRQLALLHEREHVAARDPLMLAMSAALLAITPWNPASWWMFARLRAAVELDCDRRVLRRGASVGAYGAMLLGVAGRGSSPMLAAALVEPAVLLERRILAMTRNQPRRRGARTVAFLAAGSIAALVACELNSPTTPAATAADEAALLEKVEVSPEQERELRVEMQTDAEDVRLLFTAEGIVSMQPLRRKSAENTPQEGGEIELRRSATLRQLSKTVRADSEEKIVAEKALESKIRQRAPQPEPIIFIDGRIATSSALHELPADRIERVEVLKGAAATRLYGEAGVHGVVQIFTRK
jgi:hypothetical protein